MATIRATAAGTLLLLGGGLAGCAASGAGAPRESSLVEDCAGSRVVTVSNGLNIAMDVWDYSRPSPQLVGIVEAGATATLPLAADSRGIIRVIPARSNAGYTVPAGADLRNRIRTRVHCAP